MAHEWKPRGYVLERVLGSGASADVWRARVAATGAVVAVKRIVVADREQARRAREEAALLTALEHPNLVRLHAVLTSGDSLALVLDLAGNGSLRDLLGARGRLTPGETITALAPAAAAVSYLHSRSIVHGDVSAANILFTESGTPLLGDVGVARITGDERQAESTPIYVDPAVAGGAVPDRSSDVFMLGAVAFHALTGQPLWGGDSTIAILARAVGGVPADVADRLASADVPEAMADVVLRALDARPSARGSAVEFALDLRHSATPTAVEFDAGRAVPEPVALDRSLGGRHRAGADDSELSAEPGTYPRVPRQRVTTGAGSAGPNVAATVSQPGRPAFDRPGSVVAPAAEPPTRMVGPRPRPDIPRRARGASRTRGIAVGVVVLAVGVALVLVSVLRTGGGPSAHRPPSTVRPSTAPGTADRSVASAEGSGSPTHWTQILAELDAVRAHAYAARRPDLLARVYAPGPLLTGDADQLRHIVPRGCGLAGAMTTYRSAVVVTVARPRTVLTVVVALPATRLVCAGAAGSTAPAVPARRMRVELIDTVDGPRILDERPV